MAGKKSFLFGKRNYSLFLIALSLIVLGYLLMTGSVNRGGDSFNNEIYSFRRITLAPVILLSGYSLIVFSIMSVSKSENNKENNAKTRNGKI